MPKRIVIITAILFALLTSTPVFAIDNTSQIPELNPFCWHRGDCEKINKDGFVSDLTTGPCTGGVKNSPDEWGRCLPAGTTKTEISFGGKSEFSNIGDFIIVMYKYLLTIASIVAVVVIIIAGAQWITSGGNSEAIGSAKKRIAGAVIGLFIAYMSYFVLNTINPALVNLRLPQVWLIKPQALVPEFCQELPDATTKLKFADVAGPTEPKKPLPPAAARVYKLRSDTDLACGYRFLVENGGETTCVGNGGCSDGNSCIDTNGDGSGYGCINARVYGRISNSGLAEGSSCGIIIGALANTLGVVDPWGCPPTTDASVMAVCKNPFGGGSYYTFGNDHGTSVNNYWLEASLSESNDAIRGCGIPSNLKGFAVRFTFSTKWTAGQVVTGGVSRLLTGADTQMHFIGKGGVDLGSASGDSDEVWRTDAKYLFTEDEILHGVRLDVDASDVADSADTVTCKQKQYWEPQLNDCKQ